MMVSITFSITSSANVIDVFTKTSDRNDVEEQSQNQEHEYKHAFMVQLGSRAASIIARLVSISHLGIGDVPRRSRTSAEFRR